MSVGAPNFGDLSTPVFNPLVYPRRIIIEILEAVFSQETLVTYPDSPSNPYQLKLDINGEPTDDSGIIIADTFADELLTKDVRPVIVIDRGSFQFSDTAIDGRSFGGASPGAPYLDANNEESTLKGLSGRTKAVFQDYASMSIGINCYARRSIDAETIAWLAGGFVRMFEREIREGARLHKIESPVIGEARTVKADSQHDLFICPITLVVWQTLKWVKSTTATYQEILDGIQNSSNSPWPIARSEEPCSNLEPEGLTEMQQDQWNNE
jgi:hypothetical protein